MYVHMHPCTCMQPKFKTPLASCSMCCTRTRTNSVVHLEFLYPLSFQFTSRSTYKLQQCWNDYRSEHVVCLESETIDGILHQLLTSVLEDVDIRDEVMFKGTMFVELCLTNIAVYWVVQFPQLVGQRNKWREMIETVSLHRPHYVGALCTMPTCMWARYTADKRDMRMTLFNSTSLTA